MRYIFSDKHAINLIGSDFKDLYESCKSFNLVNIHYSVVCGRYAYIKIEGIGNAFGYVYDDFVVVIARRI